eukprot:CAMPEP_0167776114 /NCGR_PEP_ID=MMETSP0111_2-20121227/2948_1 /TAXON_ID=91324 /ORGANISM="Lotharella globosa, Strain CCCM811" /LENGTH=151 /DNA_ID=CAMNT_0007666131 /DNA_START=272 /DNA_END=727 /DNA_ORIENTATION=-
MSCEARSSVSPNIFKPSRAATLAYRSGATAAAFANSSTLPRACDPSRMSEATANCNSCGQAADGGLSISSFTTASRDFRMISSKSPESQEALLFASSVIVAEAAREDSTEPMDPRASAAAILTSEHFSSTERAFVNASTAIVAIFVSLARA